jgi:hypothetical protein
MALLIPEFLQVKQYSAQAVRAMLMDMSLQPGVVGATDLKVSQRAAGINMSVDVAAGTGWVAGTSTARQGLYHCYNDGVVNLAIGSNTSGNPRIDQVILRVYDSSDGGNAQDNSFVEVLQGTPTSGATLDNRTGAATLPAHSIRLADILVANLATGISNSVIRDRRPWARGGFSQVIRTAGNYTTTSASLVAVDSTNVAIRMECTGNPVRIKMSGETSGTINSQFFYVAPWIDGALEGTTNFALWQYQHATTATGNIRCEFEHVAYPSAGSHVFSLAYAVTSGTLTLFGSTTVPLQFSVEEITQQNANNG